MGWVAEGAVGDGDPPLVVGAIHGLRRWSLKLEDGNFRLASTFNEILWESGGAPTVATCDGGVLDRPHRVPGHRCSCGLYALHPSRSSASNVYAVEDEAGWRGEIAGLVEAWGRVEVYEGGFRAQFARPLALILHREPAQSDRADLVKRVARAYRAEVLVVANPADVTAYCREHELGLDPVTVARLVPKEPEKPVSAPPMRPVSVPPVSHETRRWTLKDLAGGAMAVVVGLVCAAFWLMIWGGMALGILGAIFGWFGDGSSSATALARKHLTVVDQAVLGAASREPVYVAVVKNDDRRRAALDVTPRLRTRGGGELARLAASGRFEHPADVPPGGTAVAVDRLRAVPVGSLTAPKFQVRAFRRAPAFPIQRVAPDLDQVGCTLNADITAARPLDRLTVIGIARRGGRIAGGGEYSLDAVPRGRSTHGLGKPGAGSCGGKPPSWSLYPSLAPSKGKWHS